jgi:hypothetical protein
MRLVSLVVVAACGGGGGDGGDDAGPTPDAVPQEFQTLIRSDWTLQPGTEV